MALTSRWDSEFAPQATSPAQGTTSAREHFVFFLADNFAHTTLSCVTEPLALANILSGENLYSWTLASQNGKTAMAYSGIVVQVDQHLEALQKNDRLIVLAGDMRNDTFDTGLLSVLRRHKIHGGVIGAIGTGVIALAKAGVLGHQEVSVHWELLDGFCENFPDAKASKDLYISSGKMWSSAGGIATVDFVLNLIQKEHGEGFSLEIADRMIMSTIRECSSSQRSSVQAKYGTRNQHLVAALEVMKKTLDDPVSPAAIAQMIGISTRQLERVFKREIGVSPKRHYIEMRLQLARRLLVQTEGSITDIAMACGFSSAGHFAKRYKSRFGHNPQTQRCWV